MDRHNKGNVIKAQRKTHGSTTFTVPKTIADMEEIRQGEPFKFSKNGKDFIFTRLSGGNNE